MSQDFVEIAKIGSTYKLDGELNLYPLANSIETLLSYGDWYIQLPANNVWQPLKGESVLRRADKLYIKLANINDAEIAKKYSHLFDIDLATFYTRSALMLNRIQKNHKLPPHQEALLYRVIRQKEDVYDIVNSTFHRTNNWF